MSRAFETIPRANVPVEGVISRAELIGKSCAGRLQTDHGTKAANLGTLVADTHNLIALSCHCGIVHDTQTVASTIQNGHIPICGLSDYRDKGYESWTVRRRFESLRFITRVFKVGQRHLCVLRRKMYVVEKSPAWQGKSRRTFQRYQRYAHSIIWVYLPMGTSSIRLLGDCTHTFRDALLRPVPRLALSSEFLSHDCIKLGHRSV